MGGCGHEWRSVDVCEFVVYHRWVERMCVGFSERVCVCVCVGIFLPSWHSCSTVKLQWQKLNNKVKTCGRSHSLIMCGQSDSPILSVYQSDMPQRREVRKCNFQSTERQRRSSYVSTMKQRKKKWTWQRAKLFIKMGMKWKNKQFKARKDSEKKKTKEIQ